MAAALLGVDADALASPTSTAAGALLETFVLNELARQGVEPAGLRTGFGLSQARDAAQR